MSKLVDRNKLHHYKLKLTALTPIHIGTGEVYEPTNYVIDNNTFYAFDEVLFYKSLDDKEQAIFNTKLSNYMQIIDFYKSHREKAKTIAYFECKVSQAVQNKYNQLMNKDGSKNKHLLEIQTTFKNPNTFRSIIPGSSIKGMLDTVLQIYPKKVKDNDERQNIIISDALILHGSTEIGYMRRTDRDYNEVIKKHGGISALVEVIQVNSEFILTITSDKDFDTIKEKARNYHSKRENSKYKDDDGSFIFRVGKFSGMDYIVDNINDAKQPRTGKPLGTHSLYDGDNSKLQEFGWIKVELISDQDYATSLDDIATQEKLYYQSVSDKQYAVKARIQENKDQLQKAKIEKERQRELEAKAIEEAKEKREAEIASMTPLEKEIDILVHSEPGIPKSTLILKGVENGSFSNKCEALQLLKDLLVQEKSWVEISKAKKPEKDIKYQKTLRVIKLLQECRED